jgi:thiol:disulfide interchange protein DsbG
MHRRLLAICISVALTALSGCDTRPTSTELAKVQAAAGKKVDFASLNDLHGFVVGTGPSAVALPRAYVLFDPQCPHCARLWETAKPLRGVAQIKWIPVGILNGTSREQAGMLLESKDPVTLMNANEATFAATGRPSLVSTSTSDATQGWVGDNNLAMTALGATSVPTVVYRKKGDNEISTASGEMTTNQLAELLGVGETVAVSAK